MHRVHQQQQGRICSFLPEECLLPALGGLLPPRERSHPTSGPSTYDGLPHGRPAAIVLVSVSSEYAPVCPQIYEVAFVLYVYEKRRLYLRDGV